MSETKTLIQLIQLNGKDFKKASNKFIEYYTNPPVDDMEINRNQAAMLGWAQLLHMQTGRLLENYGKLSSDPEFRVMVDRAYNYFQGNGALD
jgi:hypothetical protein